MSRKLALSSALSVMLMAGFAVFNGTSLAMPATGGADAFMPAKVEVPGTLNLPELPILR